MPKVTVKLDHVRELRYTIEAIVSLEEACNINLITSSTYRFTSPSWLRNVIWAGQLHTPKPLSREQVVKYLPTDLKKYLELAAIVADALGVAMGRPDDEPKTNTKSEKVVQPPGVG